MPDMPTTDVDPKAIVDLLKKYAGLEWTQKEVVDFTDADPHSVFGALEELAAAGTIKKTPAGKYLIEN